MKKFYSLICCSVLALGSLGFASSTLSEKVVSGVATIPSTMVKNGVTFKVGDTLAFNLTLSMGLSGTMKMAVTAQDATTVTITQDVDLTIQKENVVEVMDKSTGKIIKLTVNGQDQTPPDNSGEKVISQKAAHIKVPKGEFDCIDVVVDDGKGNQSELWVNPRDIPIGGMLKMHATQQGTTIDAELTDFAFGT
jgi:hypothetical protein